MLYIPHSLKFSINAAIHCGRLRTQCIQDSVECPLEKFWELETKYVSLIGYYCSCVMVGWRRKSPGTETLTLQLHGMCVIWTSAVGRGNSRVPNVVVVMAFSSEKRCDLLHQHLLLNCISSCCFQIGSPWSGFQDVLERNWLETALVRWPTTQQCFGYHFT